LKKIIDAHLEKIEKINVENILKDVVNGKETTSYVEQHYNLNNGDLLKLVLNPYVENFKQILSKD